MQSSGSWLNITCNAFATTFAHRKYSLIQRQLGLLNLNFSSTVVPEASLIYWVDS